MSDHPKDLAGLFKFYHEFVKPLYSEIQAANVLPNEVLFEISAAFDHLSRLWSYGESEPVCVERAYSHLKRSCLDIFKLKAKQVCDYYIELKQVDLCLIDNGEFEGKMRKAFQEIKEGAKRARCLEGRNVDLDGANQVFDLWMPVYEQCVNFEKDFYENEHIEWARKVSFKFATKKIVLASLASALIALALREGLGNIFYQFFFRLLTSFQ